MNLIKFKTKADTLDALSKYPELNIPELFYFTLANWEDDKQAIIEKIKNLFKDTKIAVRSSCLREDTMDTSAAGAFLSVLNIDPSDAGELSAAIAKVFASYGEKDPQDQVLIQEMVKKPILTGVIMTRSLQDGSHYYVINYDDESGKTDTITGGTSISKTVYIYRNARDTDFDSGRLRKIVALARRVEEICGNDSLDIEFSLDDQNVSHLLQTRPICAVRHWDISANSVNEYIGNVAEFVARHTSRRTDLYGARSILGIMPDWNPAEMIGILPHPLDTSLYRELITSRVWSSARRRMGYNAVSSSELMLILAGHPYIDIRASFNSFLPATCDPVTAEALVSAWLEYLAGHPQLHDKVEFEVAQTCLDFCFEQNMDERYNGLLTSSRRAAFKEDLRKLTAAAMAEGPDSTLAKALERVTELKTRHASRPLLATRFPVSQIGSLLEECRKYGTLPFSILARHAFIAESLLKTAVFRGALSRERAAMFKRSVRTVSGELSSDFQEVYDGHRSSLSFLEKYGHLRPGSYDILSPRYADRKDLFGGSNNFRAAQTREREFEPTAQERKSLDSLLAEAGLPYTSQRLLDYAAQAISGRELGKFVFSRNLSDVLESIAHWAESIGLGREDVAYIPVQDILAQNYSVGVETAASRFREMADKNREEYGKWRPIKLGYLIRSERDIYVVPQHRSAPNFIGNAALHTDKIRLYADSPCDICLEGKIVLIENADPGFDWIFTRGISGLITKFGGANSHMAIRCAEYGLPAAIGVGEHLFEQLQAAQRIHLDPSNAILASADYL